MIEWRDYQWLWRIAYDLVVNTLEGYLGNWNIDCPQATSRQLQSEEEIASSVLVALSSHTDFAYTDTFWRIGCYLFQICISSVHAKLVFKGVEYLCDLLSFREDFKFNAAHKKNKNKKITGSQICQHEHQRTSFYSPTVTNSTWTLTSSYGGWI